MDYTSLLNIIEADQSLVALAEAGNDIGVATALNAKNIANTIQYQLTTLKVMDILGPIRGTAVMTALRANSTFAEIVKLMDMIDAGVNLKHPDADTMFELLVTNSILTQDESTQILDLRNSQTSLAEQTLGQSVEHLDVAKAWAGRT